MSAQPEVTHLADFTCQLGDDVPLPAEVDRMARLCLLDWIGCATSGAAMPGSAVVRDLVRRSSASGASTLVGTGLRADAAGAALYNGYSSHVLEYDDTQPSAYAHITSPVMAAGIAVAEEQGASVGDLVTAFTAGYEVASRLGTRLGKAMFEKYHVHPTAYMGYLGAAVAAAKLLGLSRSQTAMAISIAGLQAGGLLEGVSTMAEGFCAAHSSAGGVQSARLAAAGFEGPASIIDGAAAIWAAFGVPKDASVAFDGQFGLLQNEFKLYPSCGFTHPMLDALLELRPLIEPSLLDGLHVAVRLWRPAADLVDRPSPANATQAQFSAQFCAAVAVIEGSLSPSAFRNETLRDPDVLRLMSRVTIERDDSLNRHEAEVHVTMPDKEHSRFASNEGREVTTEAVIAKFVAQVSQPGRRDRLQETIEHVLTGTDLGVTDLITPFAV